jgi:hypothetical protein
MRPSQVIKEVCESLLFGDKKRAQEIARIHYPFRPTTFKEISAPLLTPELHHAKKAAKLNFTLEEIGWSLHSKGELKECDA